MYIKRNIMIRWVLHHCEKIKFIFSKRNIHFNTENALVGSFKAKQCEEFQFFFPGVYRSCIVNVKQRITNCCRLKIIKKKISKFKNVGHTSHHVYSARIMVVNV